MGLAIDTQISGVEDDGSETGQIRANVVASGLVPQEWRRGSFAMTTAGTTAVVFREEGVVSTLGVNSGFHIDLVKPVAPGTLCEIRFAFRGRRFGLAFMRRFGNTMPNFSCFIDGTAYKIDLRRYLLVEDTDPLLQEQAIWECPDMLPDGEHECRIVLLPDLQGETAGTDNVWFINCYLVESRAGYPASPNRGLIHLPYTLTTLTTSYVNLPVKTADPSFDFGISGQEWRVFRKIFYHNISASPVTVTIAKGNVAIREIILAAAGSVGSSGEFDPGVFINFDSSQSQSNSRSWSHKASANSAVNWLMLGGI